MIEAWIDVGGTFTDCYLRQPQAPLQRLKTLSSGRTPLGAGQRRGRRQWTCPELCGDCPGFWTGAQATFFDDSAVSLGTGRVASFVDGVLEFEREPPSGIASQELHLGVEAPVLAVRRLLQRPLDQPLPKLQVRLGTTKGTNALLTRRGAKTALAITAPFEDLLTLGDQTRPDLFALAIERPPPLAELAIGIRERLDAAGGVLTPLDASHARQQLLAAREAGFESLAICLMHGYLNPQHELELQRLAREVGFTQISCSSQLAPLVELVARGQTTVVDAYLSPVIRGYLQRLVDEFGGPGAVQLQVMTSAGGLVEWEHYSGKDSILSGPAGGVAALRGIAVAIGRPALIGLDMGGTSTDVSRVSEEHNLQYESTKAGVRILTPTLPIETVASGGGSICWFDGVSLRVGPQSAGASPGPACYGRGGPLTVTDLNVFLGRIPAAQFPFPLDETAIEVRLDEVLAVAGPVLGLSDRAALAVGFRRIANAQMAEAVRTVSMAQGADPRAHALLGFGGAAGQHICEIAETLDIREIFDSQEAGLLSALGMGLAEQRRDAALAIYQPLESVDWPALEAAAEQEAAKLQELMQSEGAAPERLQHSRWLELRYAKSDAALTIPWTAATPAGRDLSVALRYSFEAAHRQRFGYARPAQALELVALRLEALSRGAHHLTLAKSVSPDNSVAPTQIVVPRSTESPASTRTRDKTDAIAEVEPSTTPSARYGPPHIQRDALLPGMKLQGPCLVLNQGSTLAIEGGWSAECLSEGTLRLWRQPSLPTDVPPSNETLQASDARQAGEEQLPTETSVTETSVTGAQHAASFDPVFRDCFAQRLSAIATQMGVVLQQTAVSVNVKQRRDYSCAVFNARGQLLANAPHVPVHLGAMGQTVRAIIEEFSVFRAGDSFVTNDPYRGGSHLPDVTVVTPVFRVDEDAEAGSEEPRWPEFFVANRAHHADIGGLTPGSMSIHATRLGEEGVVIEPMRLTAAGDDCSHQLRLRMQTAEYPPRNIDENLADLAAQLAANARGVQLLQDYAAASTWEQLSATSERLLDAAEARMRCFLSARFSGTYAFEDSLDDGTPIRAQLSFLEPGGLCIDFTGSGATSVTNLNANPSIVTAAVLYVLRCLIADDMPLNEGVLRCVRLVIPPGILNPSPHSDPANSPAVAAGNVETSQRIVDVLLGALGVAAASQGTMNNLLFGNSRFGFYETICGGAGATAGHAGASGVHTHMTNTRLTDPEILELRYPVRLLRFHLRRRSGGAGRWRGGEGVVRVLEFLEPVELSLLTSRRGKVGPFGMAGGLPGRPGSNVLLTAGGARRRLASCCQLPLAAGDRLLLRTPGGGGFGPPPDAVR